MQKLTIKAEWTSYHDIELPDDIDLDAAIQSINSGQWDELGDYDPSDDITATTAELTHWETRR